MVMRPVILSPSFSAFRSLSSCTASAVGLNESCAAAGCATTNSSANAAHKALRIEALRVECELAIAERPSVSRYASAAAPRATTVASAGRRIAIGRFPAPHPRTVTALHHALLVDFSDDRAIAREQRLGRAHLGANRQLALGETVCAVFGVLRRSGVCLRPARAIGALVHLAARPEVSNLRVLRRAERTCIKAVSPTDAKVLGLNHPTA